MDRFGDRFIFIDHRDVGILFFMIADNVAVVDRSDVIAVGHDDQLRLGFLDIGVDIAQSLQPAAVINRLLAAIRRQDCQTALFTGEVPLFAGPQMVHQGLEVALGDNSDILYAGIDHIGKHKIDQTISSAKRHRCHRAVLCDFAHHRIVHIGKYDSQCLTHHRRSPPVHPAQSLPWPAPWRPCRSGFPWQ